MKVAQARGGGGRRRLPGFLVSQAMATAPNGAMFSAPCLTLLKAETASRSAAPSFLPSRARLGLNREKKKKKKYLKYFIVRAHVASARPRVDTDTDAVGLFPPRARNQEFLRPPPPPHDHSSAIHAHAYRARCQPHTVQNSCQMRLRAPKRTANKGSPSLRPQAAEAPWVGGLPASRHESNRLRVAPGEMPVHEDHQGKAPAAFCAALAPTSAACGQLRISWELGCRALGCALTRRGRCVSAAGAPELRLVQPDFAQGEIRSLTPGVLG